MARKSAFIYADELASFELSETHPLKPIRLRYTHELLDGYNAFGADEVEVAPPREADDDESLSSSSEGHPTKTRTTTASAPLIGSSDSAVTLFDAPPR